MTAVRVDPAYLAACRDADLVVRVGEVECVLGRTDDALTGRDFCLIEYADPPPGSQAAAEALRAYAVAAHPEVSGVLLRTGPGVRLGPPWTEHLTYVRHDIGGTSGPGPDDVTVLPAGPEHEERVRGWFADAFRTGAAEQGVTVPRADAEAQADTVLAAPERLTLVATLAGGEPAGHATLLPFTDEVTGIEYLELFDVLVPVPFETRPLSRLLTDAALARGTRAGLPLLGNVVHRTGAPGQEHSARVVAALHRRGWETDHVYWHAPNS
ncbi:hypothetical protein BN159_2032 [Streptomyces davaonensis JCM 4913]|uniref:N-acetyltransferase domain-containing protein n=1 Tax=Streptomyces davaonensis (strain DSM 101723 / JCM 4913 / KCC S-0913 / 768) TaxID=1214101 RepID=K4QTH5_STRDJ|nr:hypothetical protein [Streptomyces davaonensis]CCK26411.1 hypothetical protein BN159_2032 [Streptomyces davaonensis JCM 4913]